MHADGAGMTTLTVAFRNLVNAPKIVIGVDKVPEDHTALGWGVWRGNCEWVRKVPKPDRRQYSGLLLLDLAVISLIMREGSFDIYLRHCTL